MYQISLKKEARIKKHIIMIDFLVILTKFDQ